MLKLRKKIVPIASNQEDTTGLEMYNWLWNILIEVKMICGIYYDACV